MFESRVDPVVVGEAFGLEAIAYPAARPNLERATDLFRLFREQPTPELAHSASESVRTALSPNERLQMMYHPLSSHAIVPLFALANAGIVLNGRFLAQAYASPVTLGILLGYVLGKPIGILSFTWGVTRLSRDRVRLPVGWASVIGGGAIAGIGFTVSLLIATLAFGGIELQEAKLGVLSAALCASALTWIVSSVTSMLPREAKLRALVGSAQTLVDLAVPVDVERDHVRGPADALVTLVEYGDFECPNCGHAEPVIRELLADFGDLWRPREVPGDVRPVCSPTSASCSDETSRGMPPSSRSTVCAFRRTCVRGPSRPGSPRTSNPPTSAGYREHRCFSSTVEGTTAPMTSTR